MSSISFHSKDRTVSVSGAERAHMGITISDLSFAVSGMNRYVALDSLMALFPEDHYIHRSYETRTPMENYLDLRTVWAVGSEMVLKGFTDPIFTMQLNTVVAMGGEALKFIAFCHGQCEIHGWVDWHSRRWLADVIEEALEVGLLRKRWREDQYEGWEGVIELLRGPSLTMNSGPIVTSYSVTDGFPNSYVANQELSEEESEAWYEDLSAEEQWDQAVEGLRQNEGKFGGEWSEEKWKDNHFGAGETAFDVAAVIHGEVVPKEAVG